jgi:uncharacterized membrane protein YphA (DoxX/SURF4 family)
VTRDRADLPTVTDSRPGTDGRGHLSARTRTAAPWVGLAIRLVLAGVLAVAGGLKIGDPAASVAAVRAYQLLPEGFERLVGYGLPFLELGLAVLLLVGLGTRLAALVTFLLMAAFVVGIASAWARGLSIDCGCFGGGGEVAPEDTDYLPAIGRDLLFAGLALLLFLRPRTALSVDGPGRQGAPTGPDDVG